MAKPPVTPVLISALYLLAVPLAGCNMDSQRNEPPTATSGNIDRTVNPQADVLVPTPVAPNFPETGAR